MQYSENSEASEATFAKPLVKESSTFMTDSEAEKMCKLFADGLEAGIGYDRIFEFMSRQGLGDGMIAKLRLAVIEYGDQLGEAFTRLGLLDAVSRKMILVAEEQGELVPTFREQGRNFAARDRRRKNFAYAFAPSVALLGFTLILLQLIIVMMNGITEGSTWDIIEPALITGGIQGLTAIAIIVTILWGWLQVPVDLAIRDTSIRFFLLFPLISKPIKYRSVANFCRYLRQSVRAGMDMSRSIELAGEASNNPRISSYISPSIEAIEAGYSLEQSLSVMKGLDRETLDYIAIGEETGKLEENLAFLAGKFDKLADDNFERLIQFSTRVFQYTIMVGIFIAVGYGIMGMFLNFRDGTFAPI